MQRDVHGFDLYEPETYMYKRKHVYSCKNNPLSGVTIFKWAFLLRRYYSYIEACYIPRVIFITLLSMFNSILALIENILYSKLIEKEIMPDDIIFIIGHPRTGTTLLHNLLSTDSEHFYYVNTFQCGFPSSFLWFEEIGKYLFQGVIDKKRPMDNMDLHFDLPQEDELATNMLSGGCSYYMPLWFMKQEHKFRYYLGFNNEHSYSLEKNLDEEKARWMSAFSHFIKKVSLRERLSRKNTSKRRLVLKSPVHTAKVELLRRVFPRAKFIYIHRDPYEVFQSAVHMADSTYWYSYLNTPTEEQILAFIYWQFEHMFKAYNAAACTIGDDGTRVLRRDVLEVSYRLDLLENPIQTLHNIYGHIFTIADAPTIDDVAIKYKLQVEDIRKYVVNKHASSIPQAIKQTIDSRWQEYFITFKYMSKYN